MPRMGNGDAEYPDNCETTMSTLPPGYSPGLEGIIAGETAICSVEDGLRYRGYAVSDLANQTSFDEVAYLLLYGDLPSNSEFQRFQARVAMARRLPHPVRDLLPHLPNWTPPLDALRTAVSALAHFDQDVADNSHEANLRKAERLLAQIPVVIADYHRFSQGLQPIAARQDLSHSANFLYMLRGTEASETEVRALDVSLILYAEHELNASTFAARVIASTLSDLHSAITGAIGALKGSLHGGANEKVMDILREAGGPDTAERWAVERLQRKERIMGFGHRVYKQGDERAKLLKQLTRQVAEERGPDFLGWEETAERIEAIVFREKGLLPNLDWPAGRLYNALELAVPLYTPIFAMARVAGWSAHVIEQLDHNRLIRPRAQYIGPGPRVVVPLQQRA